MIYENKRKKENNIRRSAEDLIAGGTALSLGAGEIENLPASAAKTGVQRGLSTAGSFFPTIATIGAAGIVVKQLKNIRKPKKEGYKL